MSTSHAQGMLFVALFLASGPGCSDAEMPAAEAPTEELAIEGSSSAIIGGRPTDAFPAVGALTYRGQTLCTGTVFAPRQVLTAAHCVVDFHPWELRFVLGPDAERPERVLEIAELRPHPRYHEFVNDIAVITLAYPAPVEPIGLLGQMDYSWVGTPLLFVGYGVTDGRNKTGAGRKRSIAIPIAEVAPTTFRYSEDHGGTCNGDSGGPALYREGAGEWLVAGVTSYGDVGCLRYAVDTRVDAFLGFILDDGGDDEDDLTVEEEDPTGTEEVHGWEDEPNDVKQQANRLDSPCSFAGTIGRRGDVDWYRVVVPGGATLQVDLTVPMARDYDLVLYDSSSSRLAAGENDEGEAESLIHQNSSTRKRVLYLKVFGFEGSYTAEERYRLTFGW
ncbi:MAG: trypsin-like serine protease [Deltaproteobacteria bacterium]|nr:trypsin-like serine protease [Deltaproteobacteria bacterium]